MSVCMRTQTAEADQKKPKAIRAGSPLCIMSDHKVGDVRTLKGRTPTVSLGQKIKQKNK